MNNNVCTIKQLFLFCRYAHVFLKVCLMLHLSLPSVFPLILMELKKVTMRSLSIQILSSDVSTIEHLLYGPSIEQPPFFLILVT